MTPLQIERISQSVQIACEEMGRSPSVEEIQDLVEKAIMAHGAFEVAKEYITYRYTRSLLRQSNTTDDRILSLIECNNEEVKQENANKNPTINAVQRDYMAGEVSKDITSRILLPKEVVDAHEAGIIHFHDADYYAQHMHNCDLVNLEDMLQNGTVISGTLIEKPHSFSTACNIATQIIAQVASNQYGGQSISLTHLAPFVQVSREKIRKTVEREMAAFGVAPAEETISRWWKTACGRKCAGAFRPSVSGRHPDDHQWTGSLHHRVHVPQRSQERAGEEGSRHDHRGDPAPALRGREEREGRVDHPRLPQAHLRSGGRQRPGGDTLLVPDPACRPVYRQADGSRLYQRKKMREYKLSRGDPGHGDVYTCMGCRSFLTPTVPAMAGTMWPEPEITSRASPILRPVQSGRRHHQSGGRGVVLRRDVTKFWEVFEDRLELCHRALRCRHERLKGTLSDAAPILWQYGALARLPKGEPIDKLLYGGYSTISLGYAGLYECVRYMTGKSHTDDEAKPFALSVMQKMNDKCLPVEDGGEYRLFPVRHASGIHHLQVRQVPAEALRPDPRHHGQELHHQLLPRPCDRAHRCLYQAGLRG